MTIHRLEGRVQHYPWGDTAFIPSLLGIENPTGRPFAELWLGAHDALPSLVEVDGERVTLSDVLDGELPYLLKILSATKPLSIQAHPSADQARAGFLRETAARIALDAPHRNYRDDRPKPELLCALTDFYALRGFRAGQVVELERFESGSLKALYETLMTLPQAEVDGFFAPRLSELRGGGVGPDDREYWLLRCHDEFSRDGHYDRGLFSIYLLNLLHLKPGEAIYLDAGTLHAYLEGSGVEIMANSNNVLRGGLTDKHVDIPELLSTIDFVSENPDILTPAPVGTGEWRYVTPAREFELRRVSDGAVATGAHGPEILIVTEGSLSIDSLSLKRGQAAWIPEGVSYRAHGTGTAYKATVPR